MPVNQPSSQTAVIPTHHTDLLSSLSLSHHGNLLATSSLDHSIRIFSLSPSTLSWEPSGDPILKAHDAPVLNLAWAHPEFGVLLASAGVDGVINLWVQASAGNCNHSANGNGGSSISVGGGGSAGRKQQQQSSTKWIQRASLAECRGTVRDLEFASAELGLKLAAISSDSHLRIWECLDPVALIEWSLIEDIDLSLLPSTTSTSTGFGGVGVGVGADGTVPGLSGNGLGLGTNLSSGVGGPTTTKGFDVTTSTSSSSFSPSKPLLAPSTSSSLPAPSSSQTSSSAASSSAPFDQQRKDGRVESDGGWALSWCKEHWWGERLAVCSGSSGLIRVRPSLSLPPVLTNPLPPLKKTALPPSPTSPLDEFPKSLSTPPRTFSLPPLLPILGSIIWQIFPTPSFRLSRW